MATSTLKVERSTFEVQYLSPPKFWLIFVVVVGELWYSDMLKPVEEGYVRIVFANWNVADEHLIQYRKGAFMDRYIYWCLRGLGYLFFAFCALVWITLAGSSLFLLIRLISYLVADQLINTVVVIAYGIFGYILFLSGRFLLTLSLKFKSKIR